MKTSLKDRLRSIFTRPDESEEKGFALAEVVVAMVVSTIVIGGTTTMLMHALSAGEAEQGRFEARSDASLLSNLIDDAVRSSAGVARTDEWGTSMWLRQSDGSCTEISLVGDEVQARNFTVFSPATDHDVSVRVLWDGVQARDDVAVFTPTNLGVQVAMATGSKKLLDLDMASAPINPATTPDTECTYVPFS